MIKLNDEYILVTQAFNPPNSVSSSFNFTFDEEIALIYYIIAKNGKKPKRIIPVYYPLIMVELLNDYVVLVDPVQPDKIIVPHTCPSIDDIYKIDIKTDDIEGFTESLSRMYDKLKNILKKAEKKKIVINNVISDEKTIREIENLLNRAKPYNRSDLKGVIIPSRNINDEEINDIKNKIINLVEHVENDIIKLNELKNHIINKYEEWRNHVEKIFEHRFGEVEKSINTTKKLVEEKISLLEAKYYQEIKLVQNKYKTIIDTYIGYKRRIDDEIRELEIKINSTSDQRLAKRYREMMAELKRYRQDIESKIKKAMKNEKNEIKKIKDRYEKLITSEKKRLKHIIDEKTKLDRSRNAILNKSLELINKITHVIDSIIEKLTNEKNLLTNYFILNPYPGYTKLFIRYYIVGVESRRGEEYTCYWPSIIDTSIINHESLIIKPYQRIVETRLKKKTKEIIESIKGGTLNYLDISSSYNLEDVKRILREISLREEYFDGINIYVLDKVKS